MTSYRFTARRAARAATVGVAVTAISVVLSACGSVDPAAGPGDHGIPAATASAASTTPTAHPGTHNAQDVSFAQQMIPHHQQAVAMARLAGSRARSAQVKGLAEQIEKAQAPEIATMSGWLRTWGARTPASAMPSMGAMEHTDGAMNGPGHAARARGMMSDADMKKLAGLSGRQFDTAFLTMMIDHHRGAIAMAETERAKGSSAGAEQLAASVITSQSDEITHMTALLGS